ncbi:MAG: hypothetical protein GF417_05525 [Candidatus Latescibacteria bacterium]|nr:hypothetical protein [bacterium]MBD3423875.1 hypothetical protein [Candidatus Latescibacterota bacterium]
MRKHLFMLLFFIIAVSMMMPPDDASAAAKLFKNAVGYTVGDQPQCVRTGDFNEDGIIDLVSADFSTGVASVLLGNGNGTFSSRVQYSAGSGPYWVDIADFNEDAHQDLAVANNGSDNVSILYGAGDGTFSFGINLSAGDAPACVITGYFDSDEYIDLAVANRDSDNLSIINGAGGYGTVSVGSGPVCIAKGYFNGDNDIDLVTANKNSDDLSILLGTTGDDFNTGTTLSAGIAPYEVTTADFDEDGNTDIAAVNSGSNNISVFLGAGNGTFSSAVNHSVGNKPYGIASGDFNEDGHMDLAAANNNSNSLSILYGAGDGSFSPAENYSTDVTPRSVAVDDFDGNGYMDLATANSYSWSLNVFINRMGVDINWIEDIANDQGRQVRICWDKCFNDDPGTPLEITEYAIYRRVDYNLASALQSPAGPDTGELQSERIRADILMYPPGDWDYIQSVPARCEGPYSAVVPTLADSSIAEGMYWSAFFVSALTSTPGSFVDSQPDSGYSMDNLSPGAPGTFSVAYNTGSGNGLLWEECEDEDFKYYRIYRGEAEGFQPGEENLIHCTADLSWTDTAAEGWKYFYMISSVDHDGNESERKEPDQVTGIEIPAAPESFALYQNCPNPFNPSTRIDFDLPAPGMVSLRVYNVKGEAIATLLDRRMTAGRKSVRWDGSGAGGEELASGVYFYRLAAGDYRETRKMILLR